ncbi:hypothetical protein B0H66DRAFT_141014 [Apodospora peruviana]|uniref:DUF4048 domain-containing protein n=1 Tax=Apodospora peruviana TaxID=516989 RepID=A0AAE0IIY8_9PEZI|nr:hypothetical protein B0H66DRAFT_141014 [Apodospora peruviana]
MTSVVLLKTCFVSACANALLIHDNHPLNIHKAITAIVARKTTRSLATPLTVPRRRHRRNCPTPATPYRRRRTSCAAYYPDFWRKTSHSFALYKTASKRPETVRRASRETVPMEQVISLQHSLEGVMLHYPSRGHMASRDNAELRRADEDAIGVPPPLLDDLIDTRSERSASTASRSTNRLSLTLPIAPPNAFPSRPTPASSTSTSFPPTPLDTPTLMSPVDPNDFITAIAAQERRVLELREELSRAESDLTRLKRQWATHEAHKKRAERRNIEVLRPIGSYSDTPDDGTPRASLDIDRRKALLLSQNSQQGTPEKSRRRVFHGGHTRTLSLLSPTKPTNGFPVYEDEPDTRTVKPEETTDSPYTHRYAPVTPSQLAKRASWAPRSAHQPTVVKQIAQDFRAGLWTFMEDLRQATVGEEPITGQGMYLRGVDGNMRPTGNGPSSPLAYGGDQDTIRASGANLRPRASSAFDDTPAPSTKNQEETESAPPRQTQTLSKSKTDAAKPSKRFSWAPLTIDSMDDNDWSNWDSPAVHSPRWSGSTVNGDIIPMIPEKRDEIDTPLKKKSSETQLPSSPSSSAAHKLEELLPPVLNRLTPSNFKRTASDFMKEWEKSLAPPTPVTEIKPMGQERAS